MKKLDFIILVEHISREMESAQRLANELNNLGLIGAIFPLHYLRHIRSLAVHPKIVIAPFFYSAQNRHHIDFNNLYDNVLALDLHAEQICDETTKNMRMPQDDYAKSILHISWSEKFSEYLISCGVKKHQILISGCNRCDGLTSSNNNKSIDVLICTSFSRTFVSDDYIEQMLSKLSFDRELYLQKIKFTRKVRDAYFTDIIGYANTNLNKSIVIRPHPYVSLIDFESKLLEINKISTLPNNIKVLRDGSIQNAIHKSKTVIAWQSSVILDARIANTQCLMLEPFDTPDYMKISFSDVIPKIKTLIDIKDLTYDYTKLDQYINNIYGTIDGKSSSRIAKWVHEKTISIEHNKSINKTKFIKLALKAVTSDYTILLLRKMNLLTKFFPLYKGLEEDYFKPIYFTKNDS